MLVYNSFAVPFFELKSPHLLIVQAIWPYSDYFYLATEDNFKEFISFLQEHHVDLTHVEVVTFSSGLHFAL